MDYLAEALDVANEFPALCGPDGWPRTWGEFIAANRVLPRVRARRTLAMHDAFKAAFQPRDNDFTRAWLAGQKRAADLE